MEFRRLKADEVECRISMIRKTGISLLLYKDARVDMKLLDESVGPMNWQKRYDLIDGQLFCSVGIWDSDKKEWIWKQDVGTESYTEKEKGRASDAFKRACFNIGIGRELYTAPFIWVTEGYEVENGKCNDRFNVTEIGYDENGSINKLVIENAKTGDVVYEMGARKKKSGASKKKTGARSNDKGAPTSKNDAPTEESASNVLKKYYATLYDKGWVKAKLSDILKQAGWDGKSRIDDDLIAKATIILMEADNEARQ